MDILDTAGACFMVDDDLLNFTLEGEGEGEAEQDEDTKTIFKGASASSSSSKPSMATAVLGHGSRTGAGSFPEFVEEELEWLSNKDAFPAVETCFGILSDNPELVLNRQSPVSVLENSSSNISNANSTSNSNSKSNSNSNSNGNGNGNGSTIASCCGSLKVPANFPVRTRSKRRRRKRRAGFGELLSQQCLWLNQVYVENKRESSSSSLLPPLSRMASRGASMGRRCLHCQSDKTPQWRAGPMGPKTLCNACGVRYKSGRLLPEYRPANSPTFSSTLHSNSHRKVIEMRRQKQFGGGGGGGGGIMVNEACGYSVG